MADVKIKVSSDTSQFQSGMKNVDNTLKGIKGSVNTLTGAIAAIGISKLASSFGSFSSGLIKDSSKAAMSFETLGVQLEVLTGSAAKGAKLLADMNKYASNTPLQLGDIQQVAKTLLQFGITAENVVPTIKMMGDASMGNGESLKSLARVFGQVSSAGRLTMEDVNQLTDAGFNPMSEMVKITGYEVSDLRDKISDGAIGSDVLTQAFKNATSAGGRFNNMLARTANTNEGKMSNLVDNVEKLKIGFGTGFNKGLGELLDKGNTVLPQLEQAAIAFGEKFGEVLKNVSDSINVDNIKADLEAVGLSNYLAGVLKDVLNNEGVRSAMSDLGKAIIPKEIRESPITRVGQGILQNKDQTSTVAAIMAYLTRGTFMSPIASTVALGKIGWNAFTGDKPVDVVSVPDETQRLRNEQYNLGNDLTTSITGTLLALEGFKRLKQLSDWVKSWPPGVHPNIQKFAANIDLLIMRFGKLSAAIPAAAGSIGAVAAGSMAVVGMGAVVGYSAHRRPGVVSKLEADIARAKKKATPEELAQMKADLNDRLDREVQKEAEQKKKFISALNIASTSLDFSETTNELKTAMKDAAERVKKIEANEQEFSAMVRSAMLGGTDAESSNFFAGKLLDDSNKKRFASDPYVPVLTSLARIGGAKSTTQDPLVTIQTRANELLQIIANNTKNNNSNRAVFN